MNLKQSTRVLIGAGLVTLTLAGCGGSSGSSDGGGTAPSTAISGTVAAGAPVIGQVTVKDSLGARKTVNIEANGKYSVDVAGMTAPFVFKAVGSVGGRELALVSAATTADVGNTINITPFTDLIVANIAGMVAERFFDSANPSATTVNASGLNAAKDNLTQRLLPILSSLGVASSIDLLRTSFNTDHTGIDKVMDIVKVTVNPDTATAEIKNIIDNATITDVLTTTSDATAIAAPTSDLNAAVTDLQAIEAALKAFSDLFKTSVPSPGNPALLAMFVSSGFLDDGGDLNVFLSNITSDPDTVGITFANPTILARYDSGNKVRVGFVVQHGSGVDNVVFEFWKEGNSWKLAGNQKLANHGVTPVVSRTPSWDNYSTSPVGNIFRRHLDLWTESGDTRIQKIKIAGTGLRSGGVILVRSTTEGSVAHFDFQNFQSSGSWLPECEGGITPDTATTSNSAGQCIDFTNVNSTTEYTFTYYDGSDVQVGQAETQRIKAAPVAKADAAANFDKWFPKITGVTPSLPGGTEVTLSNLTNGTAIRVAWTAPSDPGFKMDNLWINIGNVSFSTDGWNSTLTSPTQIGIWSGASPVVNGSIYVSAESRDSAGRRFATQEVTSRLP